MKRIYATDLTDVEWKTLEPHVPAPNKRGRPRTHSPREILDAVFYILKSGCPWRLLPRDFEFVNEHLAPLLPNPPQITAGEVVASKAG